MSTATVNPFIDKYHPQKDGKCAVSIKITYERKKKYYNTGVQVMPADFNKVMTAKRRSEAENALYKKIMSFQTKANKVIEVLPIFTFGKFEEMYFENREATNS